MHYTNNKQIKEKKCVNTPSPSPKKTKYINKNSYVKEEQQNVYLKKKKIMLYSIGQKYPINTVYESKWEPLSLTQQDYNPPFYI